jgi:putative DNA primase/helicase
MLLRDIVPDPEPKVNSQGLSKSEVHNLNRATRRSTIKNLRQNIPTLLQKQKQWVVWKYQTVDGKLKKPPFSARNGRAIDITNPNHLGTFEQAIARYENGDCSGIGYALQSRTITALDLDKCRDPQTGTIALWAQKIIDQLSPYAYVEISPSQTGIRIFINAQLPRDGYKKGQIEAYGNLRYVTTTGNYLNGPKDLIPSQDAQNALNKIVAKCFVDDFNVNTGGGEASIPHEPQHIPSLTRSDDEVLQKMFASKNGSRLERLFRGNHQGQDHSAADLSLCQHLAYWTNQDPNQIDRLFRQSGLYRDKWDEIHSGDGLTYGQMTIQKALETSKNYSLPRGPRRQERRIPYIPQPEYQETPEERRQLLNNTGKKIAEQVREHIESKEDSILLELVPPGVGKSHTVSGIGARTTQPIPGQYNLAWIAERKSMIASIEALNTFRHIEPCTSRNCEHHAVHNELAQRGYNTRSIHNKHPLPCDYVRQFREEGSAVYQLAHAKTSYPAIHDAIVIDELDPTKWLPEREITIAKLHAAITRYVPDSAGDKLLRVLQGLLTDTARNKKSIHGKAIFDALDKASHSHLINWLGKLDQDAKNRDLRPFTQLDVEDPELEEHARHLSPVVMPHILRAFMSEIVKWQQGKEWNSCIEIRRATQDGAYALYITEPLQLNPGESQLPPRIVLDATADEEIHSRILGKNLKIHRADVPVVPGTQHIAVRTGKSYGKRMLCTTRKDGSNPSLDRAIAECKFILRKIDPTGEKAQSGQIGIISFLSCVDEIAKALNIPETVERDGKLKARRAHYWGLRGSNELEDCEILLLVGTPHLHPDDLARIARALYRDDPDPIIEDYDSKKGYADPRLQHLAEYMARAELTQAAHRNRPVRHKNRIIISMCSGDIDYLPITETITELPLLTSDGKSTFETRRKAEEARIEKAYAELTGEGKQPTQSELAKAAKVRKQTAAEWMRAHHPPVFTNTSESSRFTIIDLYSTTGTLKETSELNNAPPEQTLSPIGSTFIEEDLTPEQLAEKLSPWYVEYRPYMTCHCGCKLWRPMPWSDLGDCCNCIPAPTWSDRTRQMIARLFPPRKKLSSI